MSAVDRTNFEFHLNLGSSLRSIAQKLGRSLSTIAREMRRTWVFFCDPMNSNQKSQIERNHELVREILPKGVSFDSLTQDQAYLALSHVNAYVRLSQSDRTPFEVFEFFYGVGTAEKLHIKHIDP